MPVFRSFILVSARVIATELPCVNHEVSLASPMLKIVARVPDADLSCVAQKVEVVQKLNKFTTMARVYNFVIETRWFSDFGRARNSEPRCRDPAHSPLTIVGITSLWYGREAAFGQFGQRSVRIPIGPLQYWTSVFCG